MRVLVTGASGHIGGAIARYLSETDHTVAGLSRTRGENLPALVEQHCFDVGDEGFVESAKGEIEACDAIVHAAACLDPDDHTTEIARTNCAGTQNMLRLARDWHLDHFIFISGVAVIGAPRQHPITEEHPTSPQNAYTASKLFGENLVAAAAHEFGAAVSLRVTSPVGPGLKAKRIFSRFVEQALAGAPLVVRGKGERQQDYIDVRDVSRAVELCLQKCPFGVLNVGSGVPVSNIDLARAAVASLESTSDIRCEGEPGPDEDVCWDVSLEETRKQLGFEPLHSLEDSLRALGEELGWKRKRT